MENLPAMYFLLKWETLEVVYLVVRKLLNHKI